MKCLSVGVLVVDHLCAPISHVPRPGELVITDRLELAIGGCASNAALDLARLGVDVDVIGCVGDDVFGRFIVEALQAQHVGVSRIRRSQRIGTSGTLIVNVVGEDRRFIHTPGANNELRAEDITPDDLRGVGVIYVGGYLLLAGFRAEPTAALFRRAQAAGIRTVLDVVLPGTGDHWAALEPVLPHCDVFLPNNDEAAAITGLDDPVAQAEKFHAAGARTAVVTCGSEGTVLIGEQTRLRAGTFSTPFVGGTGAGDAFDAGYIAAMLSGRSPEECLVWGSALGASCVRSIGATESVFDRAEFEAFLKSNRLRVDPIQARSASE